MSEIRTLAGLQKAAIRFVNERRKEKGLRAVGKLSKAHTGIGMPPIVKALAPLGVKFAYPVGDDVVLWGANSKRRLFHDSDTAKFLVEFDQGQYPELEIPPRPVKIKGKVVS